MIEERQYQISLQEVDGKFVSSRDELETLLTEQHIPHIDFRWDATMFGLAVVWLTEQEAALVRAQKFVTGIELKEKCTSHTPTF